MPYWGLIGSDFVAALAGTARVAWGRRGSREFALTDGRWFRRHVGSPGEDKQEDS